MVKMNHARSMLTEIIPVPVPPSSRLINMNNNTRAQPVVRKMRVFRYMFTFRFILLAIQTIHY